MFVSPSYQPVISTLLMKLELTTPALLFSTVSLLILAFNNRFTSIAGLIRKLHDEYRAAGSLHLPPQIFRLRRRLRLIRDMQRVAISSLLLSIVTMLLLFYNSFEIARLVFTGSLLLLVLAIGLALVELSVATNALNVELDQDLPKPSSGAAHFAERRLKVVMRKRRPQRAESPLWHNMIFRQEARTERRSRLNV